MKNLSCHSSGRRFTPLIKSKKRPDIEIYGGETYDLFLSGPWEQYSTEPYKTLIKKAFPELNIFDPETRPSQKDGTWFEDNYRAIRNSRRMVCYVCPNPFPGNALEVGMFYEYNRAKGLYTPDKLIIIWNDDIKPQWGMEVISRCPSSIFRTTKGAISFLEKLLRPIIAK